MKGTQISLYAPCQSTNEFSWLLDVLFNEFLGIGYTIYEHDKLDYYLELDGKFLDDR